MRPPAAHALILLVVAVSIVGAPATALGDESTGPYARAAIIDDPLTGAHRAFGRAIALRGDAMAVCYSVGREYGVYYFERDREGVWQRRQLILPPGGARNFCEPLALTENRLIIGSTDGPFIYRRKNGAWVFEEVLLDQEGGNLLAFAADHQTIATGTSEPTATLGSVLIWNQVKGKWRLTQRLAPPPAAQKAQFGAALAVAGDKLLVAAPNFTATESQQGGVFVYGRDRGRWQLRQELVASDPGKTDFFGQRIAIHGDVAAITSGHQKGWVYVFARTDRGEWVERAKLIAESDDERFLSFSFTSVAISDPDTVILSSNGGAFLFGRQAGGGWRLVQPFESTDAHYLGRGAQMFGDRLVVPGKRLKPSSKKIFGPGTVHIFER